MAAPVLTLLFLSYVMFVLSGTALIIATALAFLLVLRVALDVRDLRREPPSRPPHPSRRRTAKSRYLMPAARPWFRRTSCP